MNKSIFVIILTATILLPMRVAHSETTGWINAYELRKIGKLSTRGAFVPTKIQCKNGSSNKGNIRKNIAIKADYRKQNPKAQIDWVGAWASSIKVHEIKYAKRGFKVVSRDSFVRGTDLRIHCVLWHRPRK